ncbi:MAG: peptide ABC transporter substrate-binding protein [Oligoflexia bacterium]|nr:peptide ABC transporter substrate-binding protein [Oligoflexia bacterium]
MTQAFVSRAILLLVSLQLPGLSPGSDSDAFAAVAADPAKTFFLRLPAEPETLDWNRAHTTIETYLLMNLMEGLVSFDSTLKISPALAQSWKVSEDGRTYTFKIKKGVKWSDGVPLRAQDFAYSWKRLLSPVTAAAYAYFLFDIEGAELFNKGKLQDFDAVGIKALDEHTLQVKLARPVAHWIYIPTFWVTFPARQDIIEKHGNSWATPGRMVTVGAYTLSSHDFDSKIVLGANPNYHGQRNNIEQIQALIVKDDATALSLYEAGKLDFVTDIPTVDLKRLGGRPDLKVFPYLKTAYIGFVTNKYPISNVKVRRAIAMAIDKAKIGEILHGGQKGATSFVPPPMMAHSAKAGLPYDPAKARAEIAAAGFQPGGAPLRFELLLLNWERSLTVAQFVQDQLKKNLGAEVTLQPFDNKTFRAQLDMKSYPVFISSWSADYPDPDNFMSVFLSGSGNNRTAWKSEKYDELVMSSRQLGKAARERNYLAAQKLLLDSDAAILPLYYEPNVALVHPRAQGLELNPLNYLLLKKVRLAR